VKNAEIACSIRSLKSALTIEKLFQLPGSKPILYLANTPGKRAYVFERSPLFVDIPLAEGFFMEQP